MCNLFCAISKLFGSVFFLKLLAELFEVFPDLLLLIFAQERSRTWPPNELLEAIQNVLFNFLATEVPDCIAVLKLPGEIIRVRLKESSGIVGDYALYVATRLR